MNHRTAIDEDFAQKYLSGELREEERDAFECHYFECSECFDELQLLIEIRRGLEKASSTQEQIRPAPRWIVFAAAAACLAIVALGYAWWGRRVPGQEAIANNGSSQPNAIGQEQPAAPERNQEIARLSQVEPPPYEDIVLRGSNSEAASSFREAMTHYAKGDYSGAVAGLERAERFDPRAEKVEFFLGASYLLTNRTDPAIERFRKVLSNPSSTFGEEARLLLAKALVHKGDLEGAQRELQPLVSKQDSVAAEARRLMTALQRGAGG